MAYFGYPEAHDNDAERATHAGLAILSAVVRRQNFLDKLAMDLREDLVHLG